MLDSGDERRQMEDDGYLMPAKRDAIFHKLDLEATLAPFDEMTKDMVVMSARFEKAPAIKKHYPFLNETQIRGLIEEVNAK